MTIKQRQWQLYYLGYYSGEIDGIWGVQSKAAAVRFQKDYALDVDGIFGRDRHLSGTVPGKCDRSRTTDSDLKW